MIASLVTGVGLRGPGLNGWAASRAILSGAVPHALEPMPKPRADCLPATERRRATTVTRLALDVAGEALGDTDPVTVTSVFASSGGEVEVIHGIFAQLASPDPRLSPTAFHNSVHNTAAGYWSIASGSHHPADSLCAYDDSFGAGLAEALLRAAAGEGPVLLVAYDLPPLFPIAEFRPIQQPFAMALRLDADAGQSGLARLEAAYRPAPPTHEPMADPGLEALRLTNPAARGLPLLAALARGQQAHVGLGHGMGGALEVYIAPCS
jgi:hypothetical protein